MTDRCEPQEREMLAAWAEAAAAKVAHKKTNTILLRQAEVIRSAATPAEVEALRAEVMRAGTECADAMAHVATLRARVAELEDAAADMLAGWRYIRRIHGDLPGIGWDRAQQAVEAALGTTAPIPLAPLSAEEQRQARAALSPATEGAPE